MAAPATAATRARDRSRVGRSHCDKTPAEAVGLADRGEIAAGKRADLIRVHVARGIPVVRSVWREGRRVA
jgi:alpha-D-ribose 1-methylphosphonate 5-triphosphate diphosphatase PhnM